jgi:succinate dehydrogenase/fumarate reductase cytochrome b subunit
MVVLKLLAVFVTIVCLCYHLANGIRFLYIDFTRQISLRSITVTGIMALLAALLFFVAIVALMILPL